MPSYIYLASPYSINAPVETAGGRIKRAKRYHKALRYLISCTNAGEVLFSPIVHSHPMSLEGDLSGDFTFWEKIDFAFIKSCSKVRVLMLPEWDKSVGIKAEVAYAKSIGKEVEYVDPSNS